MKRCSPDFEAFLGNESAKARITALFEAERLPHALLLLAQTGCGRNFFARLIAASYLGDSEGRIMRGIHPDCFVIEGEGASGQIPVARVRALAYDLNKSSVMTDGRRVAIVRNVKNLNKNAANALLKILEEPPTGVLFILTADSREDLIETLRSRCVSLILLPLSARQCVDAALAQYPEADADRLYELAAVYGGRLGLVLRALAEPGRLGLFDCAGRFIAAALRQDKLAALIELEGAASRDELRLLLSDAALWLSQALHSQSPNAAQAEHIVRAIADALQALGRYMPPKLVAGRLTATI